MRVFATGGTGLGGLRLVRQLSGGGDSVVALTRRPDVARERLGSAVTVVSGDPMQTGAWMDAIADCDAVVHLAGENVFARRWKAPFKELLRDSRIQSTQNIVRALARAPITANGQPKTLVNASAIGY